MDGADRVGEKPPPGSREQGGEAVWMAVVSKQDLQNCLIAKNVPESLCREGKTALGRSQ